jgi:hypothetical protein
MHQRRGLERLPRDRVRQPGGGHLAQLVVDQGQELPGRMPIASLDVRQDPADVAHGLGSRVPPAVVALTVRQCTRAPGGSEGPIPTGEPGPSSTPRLVPASDAHVWVRDEIRRARKAEVRDGKRKLFPIRLMDRGDLERWDSFYADLAEDVAEEIRESFIPDFSTWKDHDAFEVAFARLIKDLETTASATEENKGSGREGPGRRRRRPGLGPTVGSSALDPCSAHRDRGRRDRRDGKRGR